MRRKYSSKNNLPETYQLVVPTGSEHHDAGDLKGGEMSLTPRGMSVQEAYRLYSDKKLTVNRRYQRKLVWSENEKRHLVDSIEKELPIPLFMLAKSKDEPDAYEIIDGMQRFNAIFSFIEHQFVDEAKRCFDLEQFVRAKLARDSGVFEEYPKVGYKV